MQAGTLRHRITIKNPTITGQNGFGEDVVSLVTVGSYACRIEPLTGRELEAAQQTWAEARYRIMMRSQGAQVFTRKMQITWGARTLDILDVQDARSNSHPEIMMIAKDYDG